MDLPPGFYRVSPEGSAYTTVVSFGDPNQQIRAITSNLEDEADQMTTRGQRIIDLANQSKIERGTTATYTDANGTAGQFNFTIPEDVSVVQVQAYTPAAEDVNISDVENASFADLQTFADLKSYNESFYITPAPKSVDLPANDTEIRAVEVNSPPFQDIGRGMNRSELLRDLLQNDTMAGIVTDYLELPSNMTRDEVQALHDNLSRLAQENDALRQRLDECEDINVTLENDQSTDKLRNELTAIRQEVQQLKGSLRAGDDETDVSNGTIDATIPFDGDLSTDGVNIVANNLATGETTVVSEEYWSVNKRTGRSDQVVIEDYPIDEDTPQIAFGVTASGEDGESLADTRVPISNPAFTGQRLDLEAIDVSSVQLGPSEAVTLSPALDSESVDLQNVTATVTGPNGERSVAHLSSDELSFRTDGAGTYRVKLELTDANGQSWVEMVALQASNRSVARDPSVRAVEGFTGPIAVAGDGLTSGAVETEGAELTVAAVSPQDNVPSTVHVYTEGLSNNYDDVTVRLLRDNGDSEPEQVRTNAKVFIHTTELPDDAVAFREGNQPLGINGETAYGGATPSDQGDAHVIKTHTNADGTVTVEVHRNPGFTTTAFYEAQKITPILLPRPSSLNPLSLLADFVTVLLDVGGDLATATMTATTAAADSATTVSPTAPSGELAATHGGVAA